MPPPHRRRLQTSRMRVSLYQSELAADYFQIQGLDADRRLLEEAVRSNEQYLQLTQDRFQGGVVSMADVALAQTQLEGARAQLTDLGVARAQFEHAIAVLFGRLPAELSIRSDGQPSALPRHLCRTAIGTARAPARHRCSRAPGGCRQRTDRSGTRGLLPGPEFWWQRWLSGSRHRRPVHGADTLWSLGVQLAETLFDGGKRRAQARLTQAEYDVTVANYRETVLTGFQQVEDALSGLRTLAQEADIVAHAVAAAQQSLDISTIQYRGGLANYLQVITAQTSLLQNQRATVDLRTRTLVETVSLVLALGGGWDASQLPSARDARR